MYEGVLDRLREVKRRGRFWVALCPAHEDKNPSLRLWVGDNGALIARCYACNAGFGELLRATGTKSVDWYPPLERRRPPMKRKILAVYPFHDEKGVLLSEEVRFEPDPGCRKMVRYRRPMPGGWAWSLDGGMYRRIEPGLWRMRDGVAVRHDGDECLCPVRRVPYRLPELLDAGDDPVFVVEGPKDADTIRHLGLIATSAPCGARSWQPSFGAYLSGKNVVVVPDLGEAGKEYACAVLGSCLLHGVKSIRLWNLPQMLSGKDITDLLEGDWRGLADPRAEILHRVSECQPWRSA